MEQYDLTRPDYWSSRLAAENAVQRRAECADALRASVAEMQELFYDA